MDAMRNTVWAWAHDSIYEINVHDEARDVWRIYMDRGQYDVALQYCKVRTHTHFRKSRYELNVYVKRVIHRFGTYRDKLITRIKCS